jgi:hypothetical protein
MRSLSSICSWISDMGAAPASFAQHCSCHPRLLVTGCCMFFLLLNYSPVAIMSYLHGSRHAESLQGARQCLSRHAFFLQHRASAGDLSTEVPKCMPMPLDAATEAHSCLQGTHQSRCPHACPCPNTPAQQRCSSRQAAWESSQLRETAQPRYSVILW